MCGRFTAEYTWAQIWQMYSGLSSTQMLADPEPRWNIAPTQSVPVLLPDGERSGRVVVEPLRWGLIPAWAKDTKAGYSTINARIETAATKPAFRDAWKRRRCLIPASGYYEWPGEGANKQPYYIHAAAPILMFAGLYELWTPSEGASIQSFTIITMDAEGPVAKMHDRMPLILPPDLARDWIESDAQQAAAIAQAAPVPELVFYPVGKAVGNVRNQGRGLVDQVEVGHRSSNG